LDDLKRMVWKVIGLSVLLLPRLVVELEDWSRKIWNGAKKQATSFTKDLGSTQDR